MYPCMAMIKRKMVRPLYRIKCLYNSNGIANALEMFSSTQFSIFLLESSHMPAHAVALTQASQRGTVDEVKYLSDKE